MWQGCGRRCVVVGSPNVHPERMVSNHIGGPVDAAGARYRAARAEAAARTPLMRRWRVRTLLRARDDGRATESDLIELRALVDEHRAQGGELPT